jgi:hypothetical protein
MVSTAQQTITLTIIQTGMDGETAISFDDGEYENDSIDKLNDDDLDAGWEGEDLFVMTAYTRFQNVLIPQGSVINSATLTVYAHEDEPDQANITVYAEAIDHSPPFTETEALADRTWTTASVRWEVTDPWTMWQPYDFPDLSAVVQEVIDRPGWKVGNALTLFLTGEDQGPSLLDNARDMESFENIEDPDDGGDGLHHPERIPTLVIEFTPPAAPAEGELTLTIIETGMDGETSISFDDGEYENDSIDKLNDDDLDAGWEGEDLFVMTAYTRFQNVTIPQGSVINSATLTVYAHEDEPDQANITVYAEDIDHSPMFTETEALADRTWTEASVRWEVTDPWTMWEAYDFPDLSAVIQEVIDRPGWTPGYALTLFLTGEDQGPSLLDNARDMESYENIEDPDDGGDGLHHPERIPTLVINYSAAGTGIDEIDRSESSLINVYPNPTDNGLLQVSSELTGSMRIELFSATGRLVKVHDHGSNSVMLDVSDLNEGFYVIRIIQEEVTDTRKIIIK